MDVEPATLSTPNVNMCMTDMKSELYTYDESLYESIRGDPVFRIGESSMLYLGENPYATVS